MRRPNLSRSRFARLLASGLVVLALLGNGLAWAQGSVPATADCCAGKMAAGHAHANPCEQGKKSPCPTAGDGCDDQCLARCAANAALPPLASTAIAPRADAQPLRHDRTGLTRAAPAPDLRPPIAA